MAMRIFSVLQIDDPDRHVAVGPQNLESTLPPAVERLLVGEDVVQK
jgi:hypothetical protein